MWVTCFLKVFGVAFSMLPVIRWVLRKGWGSVDKTNEISAKGKIVLITGANSGIGRSTALEFAYRDAQVILACRNHERAKDAVAWIRKQTSLGQLICMELDLSSLASIRNFCKEFNTKYDRLDILCNNAGVMMPIWKRGETSDGYEIHMGVNHLGHFLLTNLLLEPLKRAAPSRVVTMSSLSHNRGTTDFDDLFSKNKPLNGFATTLRIYSDLYSNSKLANALFSKELARRLEGTGVRSYALCAGLVVTEIGQHINGPVRWCITLMLPILKYLLKSPEEGAQTTMYCALSKNLINESGKMYRNCAEWPEASRVTLKDEDALKLWKESERLVGL